MPLHDLRAMIEELTRDLDALEKEMNRPMTAERREALRQRIANVTFSIKVATETLADRDKTASSAS